MPVASFTHASAPVWDGHAAVPSEEAFLAALSPPPHVFFEPATREGGRERADFSAPADATFFLTTLTCYGKPVAEWLAGALAKRYRFDPSFAMRLRIALHEAIGNAVIHGNLGFHGACDSLKAFDAQQAHIRARLALPEYASAAITVSVTRRSTLTLRVGDQGKGYPPQPKEAAVGRGLTVLRSQCDAIRLRRSGSLIEMDFSCP